MKTVEYRNNFYHGKKISPQRSPVQILSPTRPRMVSRVMHSPGKIQLGMRPASPSVRIVSPSKNMLHQSKQIRLSIPAPCPQAQVTHHCASQLHQTMQRAKSNYTLHLSPNKDINLIVNKRPEVPQYRMMTQPQRLQLSPSRIEQGVKELKKKLNEDLSTSIQYNMKDSKCNNAEIDRCLQSLEGRIDKMLSNNQEFYKQANTEKLKKSSFVKYLSEGRQLAETHT